MKITACHSKLNLNLYSEIIFKVTNKNSDSALNPAFNDILKRPYLLSVVCNDITRSCSESIQLIVSDAIYTISLISKYGVSDAVLLDHK